MAFSFLQKFNHAREMRESMDEIVVGMVITCMVEAGYPLFGILSNNDYQQLRFKTQGDPILNSVQVTLNRLTGGLTAKLVGNQAQLTIMAEVKNYLTDPDDLLDMYKTDLKNIFKIPLLGGMKLNHQLNSVLATVSHFQKLDTLLKPEGLEELRAMLQGKVNELREALKPYKKAVPALA